MKIGIFGTGVVGATLGSKLVSLGHEVKMGSRTANNEKAVAWAKGAGAKASQGTFADAASFGELIFHCTLGFGAVEALQAAGAGPLKGKVVIDTTNPLDFSKGFPPTLFAGNTDSLGEQLQAAFPETKIVKALNTVSAEVMVNPGKVNGGDHDLFVCGNDAAAKATVGEFLKTQFGWKTIHDLGDISMARGTETYLALWVRLYGAQKTPLFNIKVVR
ncbi:NADPH-dependent F420 reductase [Hyalangium rubrum]|uniref:NAD(P)-binding domain-containing protein n=1 Tax=Hyalangium rubrum TaxID=3103134 RepID=A0ABU5HCT8_9BACT|nr:NAD(P)-binding domain-containing protein [Hyalangium sp. s54d21]MDY7231273.1 NAD(P)-binding domain-containing protein [Hyalangium sp. s54d21]